MATDTARNPVLLLHGIDDTSDAMARLGGYLAGRGWTVGRMNMTPSDGADPLDLLAKLVAKGIENQFPDGQPIDLVCFSLGGIVARYYLQRLGGLDRVRRFITISSPHHGTWMAYFRWNAASRQLRPGCPFLADLNRDVRSLAKLQVTSIWTPFDLMIFPANSSRLPFGRQVIVPVLAHPLMQRDQRVFAAVEKALEK
ncbi:MAG: esterase/lipase family protein [Armatimonadota bacterium]